MPIRAIAEVIGRHLHVPAAAISAGDAAAHCGFLAAFLASDGPASSGGTRRLVGWRPTRPGRLDDLGKGRYFRAASAR